MKWLFTDFDNTVEVRSEEITKKNFEFLKRWHESGNKVVFASGRPVEMLKISSDNGGLNSDYYISNNGSFTYDRNLKIYDEVYITKENRKEILQILNEEAENEACIIYILPEGRQGFSITEVSNYPFGGFLHMKEFFYPNGINEENRNNDILNNERLLGIYFVNNEEYDYERVANRFKKFKNIRALKTAPVILEIIPVNVSKARGIEIITKLHDIKPENIYTAGDGDNDKEMLENYTNSYAMEHGTEIAKKSANNIIKHLYNLEQLIK